MPLPTKVSESVRRLNPHLFGQAGQNTTSAAITGQKPSEIKPRIRQRKGDGMNHWEREYLAILDIQWSHIHREVALPLANGLRYKLDFLCVSTKEKEIEVVGYEVKGFARSTGIAKLKMAARLYPWIVFFLATKRKKRDGGGWAEERVWP